MLQYRINHLYSIMVLGVLFFLRNVWRILEKLMKFWAPYPCSLRQRWIWSCYHMYSVLGEQYRIRMGLRNANRVYYPGVRYVGPFGHDKPVSCGRQVNNIPGMLEALGYALHGHNHYRREYLLSSRTWCRFDTKHEALLFPVSVFRRELKLFCISTFRRISRRVHETTALIILLLTSIACRVIAECGATFEVDHRTGSIYTACGKSSKSAAWRDKGVTNCNCYLLLPGVSSKTHLLVLQLTR